MSAVSEKRYDPHIYLMTALETAGSEFIQQSGFIAGYRVAQGPASLDAGIRLYVLNDVKAAIAKLSAAIEKYGQATQPAREVNKP